MNKTAFMYKVFAATLITIAVIACSSENKKQFEHAGGTVSLAIENEPSTYISRNIGDYYSAAVLSQTYEGLVGMDTKTIKIVPRIAEKWTVSEDGKKYTFTIRKGIKFHPHESFSSEKDRELTMDDIIGSFQRGCRKNEDGIIPVFYSMVLQDNVKGADDYYNGVKNEISGITASEQVLTIELLRPDQNFLYKLANISAAIGSNKLAKANKETEVVGTGPFMYEKYIASDEPRLILVKNNDYYRVDSEGNAIPYLDSLVFIFQSRKMDQLDLFESGEIDVIHGLPPSRITAMMNERMEDFNSKPPKLNLNNNPLLETNFYFFNMQDPRFKDPKVRQAFSYAVNKKVMGREILRNQYYELGKYGIVPPVSSTLKGYDFDLIEQHGYEQNIEKARKLLAEAGYPNGDGFGKVHLRYNINDIHSAIADEFSKQIFSVLGITVNIDGSTFDQLMSDAENGNGDIFRLAWGADYPSPETFLMNFYGKAVPQDSTEPSVVNRSRYINPQFDALLEQAMNSDKASDRMHYFAKAEVELLKNPPFIALWYSGDIELNQFYLRNFHFNALHHLDFSEVYIKPWTEEEYLELVEGK